MSLQDVNQQDGGDWTLKFDFLGRKDVVVQPSDERLSSDGGLLVIRQFDERWGLTSGFTEQLHDSRADPTHSLLDMVRQRVYGILAGYEDQNDHDALRHDAVFQLVAGRVPSEQPLASQPTLSRFENAVTPRMLLQLETWFLQQFVERLPPDTRRLTLDIDLFDDPTHGQQQLTFFHGFYDQYQYLVRVITCAENDLLTLPVLLYGTAHATLGLVADLRRLVTALRERFPDLQLHFRMDSGFASPAVYEACEELRVDYTIGLGMNAVLKARSAEELQAAEKAFAETGAPQRRFTAFEYQAGTWPQPRWVVVKCEAQAEGTNRRAIVTNRPGARILPRGAYDEYVERGESENRNKELKCELSTDRLSDHRYMANAFRMYLHCLTYLMLVLIRRAVAAPPAADATGLCRAADGSPIPSASASLLPDAPPPENRAEATTPSESAAPLPDMPPAENGAASTTASTSAAPLPDAPPAENGAASTTPSASALLLPNAIPPENAPELPVEAWTGGRRRRHFNRRREHDPLGEGHACTWRMRLIKVAARIVVRARHVLVFLSGSWPYLDHYQAIGAAGLALTPSG